MTRTKQTASQPENNHQKNNWQPKPQEKRKSVE